MEGGVDVAEDEGERVVLIEGVFEIVLKVGVNVFETLNELLSLLVKEIDLD